MTVVLEKALLGLVSVCPRILGVMPGRPGKPSYQQQMWQWGVEATRDCVKKGETIHGSKGLEFPNVSVVVDSWTFGGQPHLLDVLCDYRLREANEELLNIFYVGCTRARNSLSIGFHVRNDEDAAHRGRQLRRIWGDAGFVSII